MYPDYIPKRNAGELDGPTIVRLASLRLGIARFDVLPAESGRKLFA